MNIRQRIEGLAAYYAAKNITPDGLRELTHIVDLQEFYYSKGDMEHLRQADDLFHDAICQLSCRNVIEDTLVPLLRKTRRFRRISMNDPNRIVNTQAEHRRIFNAMMAGDAELAKALTTEHISKAKAHMIGGLKHNG